MDSRKTVKKEKLLNVPNILTLSRFLITFYVLYLILARESIVQIVVWFTIGMITDFLDGYIARRFNQCTQFGAKFDMLADRFLMIMTVAALLFFFTLRGVFTRWDLALVFMIMSREIISFPFALIAFWNRKKIPKARFIGKLTTFMQGVTFPLVLLSIPFHSFSIFFIHVPLAIIASVLAILTCAVGIVSGLTYMQDFKA